MQKDNVIFQDSGRNNVDNGKTEHKGLELNSLFTLADDWSLSLTASYARHTYESNIAPRGVSVLLDGKDIDTAPKLVANGKLNWQINDNSNLNLEWVHMDKYWMDESNTHEYEGHDLFNLRYQYSSDNNWYVSARITNLLDEDYAERADVNAFSDFTGDRASQEVCIFRLEVVSSSNSELFKFFRDALWCVPLVSMSKFTAS